MDDTELLRKYVEQGSEPEFAELVNRHGGSVYASALRQVGNAQMAEDITQAVFVALARKAPGIGRNVVLAGWLHRATRFAALHLMRNESRRRERESQSQADLEVERVTAGLGSDANAAESPGIARLLEEALDHLPEPDRNAILLRYWERRSLRDVGQRLGQNEEAAKKRVSRGIEKLRRFFRSRGVVVAAGTLAGLLDAQSATAPCDPRFVERMVRVLRDPSGASAVSGLDSMVGAISSGFLRSSLTSSTAVVSATAAVLLLAATFVALVPMRTRLLQSLALLTGIVANTKPQADAAVVDPTFRPVFSRPGEYINKLVALSDGAVMVWGGFDLLEDTPSPGLARVGAGGTVDAGFAARTRAGELLHVAADGSVVLRGALGLAKLRSDGSPDSDFNLGSGVKSEGLGARLPAERLVTAAATEPDGRILIAGWFTEVQGVRRPGVARLTRTGAVDPSFDPGGLFEPTLAEGGLLPRDVAVIVRQNDGKWVVAGDFDEVSGRRVGGIVRLHSDGRFDDTFLSGTGVRQVSTAPGGFQPGRIAWMRCLPDDRLLIFGQFNAFDGQSRPGLAMLRAEGSLDSSYTPATSSFVPLDAESDGKLLIAIYPSGTVRRLATDGSTDASFRWSLPGTSSGSLVTAAASLPDGRIVVAQSVAIIAGNAPVLKWLGPNGTVQAGYTVSARLAQRVRAIVPRADGTCYVGGEFNRINGSDLGPWVRLQSDGTVDRSYRPEIRGAGAAGGTTSVPTVWQALPQRDGRMLLSGFFESFQGNPRPFLARLQPDGSLDSGYRPSITLPSYGAAYALQTDDKLILASASLTRVGAVARRGIARLNVDGSVDATFDPGEGVRYGNLDTYTLEQARALAVQQDGRILLAGILRDVAGISRTNLVRFLPDGGVDLDYDPGPSIAGQVLNMALQAGDRLVLGGDFDRVAGQTRTGLARLNPDGSVDPSWDPVLTHDIQGTILRVTSVQSQSSGHVIISGNFTHVDGVERRGVARLHQDGSLDRSWDLGSQIVFGIGIGIADSSETRLIVQAGSDGSTWVGGSWLSGQGQGAGLLRFLPPTAPTLGAIRSGGMGMGVSLALMGPAGFNYRLETSSDLATWAYWTNAAPGHLAWPVGDEATPSPRFIRAIEP